MSYMNRMGNAKNEYQTDVKKVLCICSAGLLRSPTTAVVLSQEPYNYNTRAAGIVEEYALVPVDEVLIHWADEIVCVEPRIETLLRDEFDVNDKHIVTLDLPDMFEYRNPVLIELIKEQYGDTLRNT